MLQCTIKQPKSRCLGMCVRVCTLGVLFCLLQSRAEGKRKEEAAINTDYYCWGGHFFCSCVKGTPQTLRERVCAQVCVSRFQEQSQSQCSCSNISLKNIICWKLEHGTAELKWSKCFGSSESDRQQRRLSEITGAHRFFLLGVKHSS